MKQREDHKVISFIISEGRNDGVVMMLVKYTANTGNKRTAGSVFLLMPFFFFFLNRARHYRSLQKNSFKSKKDKEMLLVWKGWPYSLSFIKVCK